MLKKIFRNIIAVIFVAMAAMAARAAIGIKTTVVPTAPVVPVVSAVPTTALPVAAAVSAPGSTVEGLRAGVGAMTEAADSGNPQGVAAALDAAFDNAARGGGDNGGGRGGDWSYPDPAKHAETARAATRSKDAQLISAKADLNNRAKAWTYTFHSRSGGEFITVMVEDFGTKVALIKRERTPSANPTPIDLARFVPLAQALTVLQQNGKGAQRVAVAVDGGRAVYIFHDGSALVETIDAYSGAIIRVNGDRLLRTLGWYDRKSLSLKKGKVFDTEGGLELEFADGAGNAIEFSVPSAPARRQGADMTATFRKADALVAGPFGVFDLNRTYPNLLSGFLSDVKIPANWSPVLRSATENFFEELKTAPQASRGK